MVLVTTETEECRNCEEPFDEEELVYDAGQWLCPECIDAVFVDCDACGTLVHEDEAKTILRDSASYCLACVRKHKIHDPDFYREEL